jgi:hypothetical protein
VRSAAVGCLLLASVAHAEETSRFALSTGVATLQSGPADLADVGFHVGGQMSYHFNFVGPVLNLDIDRFGTNDPFLTSTTFVSMGGGMRAFLARPKMPVAFYLDLEGAVAGSTNPIGRSSSFLGGAAGGGVEWLGGLNLALSARYMYLSDGPQMTTFSLVIALGAP